MNRDLSVVVVSWNTRDALARCLESVAADPIGARAEVWVVDNNSSDGSSEMVRHRFPRARLIENHTNRGFAAACNQALAQVTAPVVLLLNSDATLERGALDHLIDVLDRRPEVAVVGGLLIGPDGQPRRSYGEVPTVGAFIAEMLGAGSVPLLRRLVPAVASPPRRREGARVVGYVVGACLVFRRELLDLVGPLDERFFLYFEEADFCLRVRNETGRLVWFEPAARVRHEGQASARQLGTQAEALYARSAYAFVRKHFGARSARRLSIAFRAWLAAQAAVHRVGALAGRPGSADALARKQRLRGLHRELGRGQEWGWAA